MLSASEEILPLGGADGTTWQFRLAAITVYMIAYHRFGFILPMPSGRSGQGGGRLQGKPSAYP